MNLKLSQQRKVQGSVLIIALITALILGTASASFMALIRWQNRSVARSQAWNSSLALAEAGVEEALAQLNPAALLFTTNIDRGANGWTYSGSTYQCPTRQLHAGSYGAAITSDLLPVIYATGYVTIPTLSVTVARKVRVETTLGSIFRGVMAARIDVDFKGNKVWTDSFDSMDPSASTGGLYDPAKRRDHGDIASTGGILNVQNANVMGTLYTGPEGGYTVGTQGSVGDLGWVLGGSLGLQSGHYKNDFNEDFPEVLPPYSAGIVPTGMTIGSTNYYSVLTNQNYILTGSVKLNTGDTILVTGAKARLYVTGNFIMGGSSRIAIAPGASLELYVGGADTAITSVNNAGNCTTFKYFGLPSNTSLALSGNDAFLGTIYAPSARFTLGGGGSDVIDFQGACAVNEIKMNGHFRFHFDENLKRKGPARGFQIASWSEI